MASSSSSSSVSLPIPAHHNLCAYLLKSKGSDEYHGIIDFLTRSNLHFALTTNPTIYLNHLNDFWKSAKITKVDGKSVIVGTVAKRKITVSEASIRAHLRLDDANGMDCFAINQIFDHLVLLGYEGENTNKLTFFKSMFCPHWKFLIHTMQQCISQKRTSFDQFSSNIATALICLANNLKFNFSKLIFTGMIYNLEHPSDKFLMYPRFLQIIFDAELSDLPRDGDKLVLSSHTKKIFANMKMVGTVKGKKFSERVTELTAHMTGAPSNAENEPSPSSAPATQSEATPSSSQPRVVGDKQKTRYPQPTKVYAKRAKKQAAEAPLSQQSQPMETNEVVTQRDDHMVRAATTDFAPLGEQDSGNILRTQSMATQDLEVPLDLSNADISLDINKSSGPSTKNKGTSVHHLGHGTDGGSSDPLKEVNTSRSGEDSYKLKKLTKTCTKMYTMVKRQQAEMISLKKEVERLNDEIEKLKGDGKPKEVKRAVRSRKLRVMETTSSSSSSSFESELNKYEFTGAIGGGAGSSKLTENQANDLFAQEETRLANEENLEYPPLFSGLNQDELINVAESEPEDEPITGAGLFEDVLSDEVNPSSERTISDPSELSPTEKEVAEVLIQVAETPVHSTAAPSRNVGITLNEPVPSKSKEKVNEASGSKVKDKGKGILEEPEKINKKKKAQEDASIRAAIELDAELNAEGYESHGEQPNLIEVDFKPGMKVMMTREEQVYFDEALCQGMYQRQWSDLTPEERQAELQEMLRRKRIFEAEQRSAQKRAKPLTKTQLRDIYARYIKNQTGYTLTSLRRWDFEDLKRKYEALHVFTPMSIEEVKRKRGLNDKQKKSEKKKDQPTEEDDLDLDRLKLMVVLDENNNTPAPLQVQFPIIDWYLVDREGRSSIYKVVRAGDNIEFYENMIEMLQSFTRLDIDQMWEVAQKKYADVGMENDNKLLYIYLKRMYEPDPEEEYFKKPFSHVSYWYCFDHNAIYYMNQLDASVGYFKCDVEYPFDLELMKQMLELKVICKDTDLGASLIHSFEQIIRRRESEAKKD